MGILTWVIFGGIIGWIASLIMNNDHNQGIILNVVVGIIGALMGGYIMNFFGYNGITGFNLYSSLVAILGSVILIWLVRLVRRAA